MSVNIFDLTGKWALVTGASRGIGRSCAIGLAQAGASVILSARNKDLLDKVANEIEDLGTRAQIKICDMADAEAIRNLFAELDQEIGTLDIVVNNAGIINRSPAESLPETVWEDIITVNLKGMFILCQEAGKRMLERGNGKIINIASILGFSGGINVSAYAASKGGVVQLTKALSNEWAHRGIHVNAIAPGYFETDFTESLRNDDARYQAILERIPTHRWGKPEEIQGAVIFLASSASNYVHGHTLVVDGGWMAR